MPVTPPFNLTPETSYQVKIPEGASFWRKILAFSGPGYLVSVGYMDPGNWATDIAGGSAYGYTLLSVILISNFMAIFLQALCVRLGIGTGLDLAQACRRHYPRPVAFVLWVLCEIAIIACDLAEVIGTAIALQLLFGLPLVVGIGLTAFDTILILFLQSRGFRYLEAFIITLILIVGGCFAVELALVAPSIEALLRGYIPDPQIVTDPGMLYIAIGILGATVMPHNLYLHSAIVKTRDTGEDTAAKRETIKFATIDSTIALMFALFINSAILIMAAATFHQHGMTEVAEIQEAHRLLTPLLGTALASVLFALALLASGQNSTITATLAGQIVMEGFLDLRLPPWLRRIITRLIALTPALLVAIYFGAAGTAKLLILSQVILSMQLPFAVIPLVQFTGSKKLMGNFSIGKPALVLAWIVSLTIVGLNIKLLVDYLY